MATKQNRKLLTFQAGEISPRYFGRSDTEIYFAGLDTALNMVVDQRGGIRKRVGLEHVAQVDGDNARVFTLQASRTRFYTIVIYHLSMLILAPGARVLNNNLILNGSFLQSGLNWLTAAQPAGSKVLFELGECSLLPDTSISELVANADFNLEGVAWTVRTSGGNSSVAFNNSRCLLSVQQSNNSSAGVAQQLTTTSLNAVHNILIDADLFNTDLRVRVGTFEGDGSLLDTTIAANASLAFTPATNNFWITLDSEFPSEGVVIDRISVIDPVVSFARVSQQVTVFDLPTDEHIVIIAQNTTAPLHIDIGTTDGASDIASIVSTSQGIELTFIPNNPTYFVSVSAFGAEASVGLVTFIGTSSTTAIDDDGLLMPAPWTEDQLDEIHMIESQEGDALYFAHPNVPVQKLLYNRATDLFTDLTPAIFTSTPFEWSGTNHPSTGASFQGRLWLGGTPAESQTLWGSVAGSPEDFTKTAGEDSSAIEFTLQQFGRIEWVLGTKTLIIGTDTAEIIITASSGVISQSDLQVETQSTFGSNNMQATQVGEKVFYVTPDGRKLRAMAFNRDEQNYLSQDLTFVSEHVTQGIAKRAVWAQNPSALYLMVMVDGTIASLTYERTAQAVAWTRFDLGEFKVLDIGTGREDGRNQIVVVGQRTPGKIDIEIQAPANQFLDSYVGKFDINGTNVIDGLEHLEGVLVRPIVDGAVDPLQFVVGGQILTQRSGQQLYAGVGYTGRIKTLPPDAQSEIRSYTKRWNKIWAYLLQSKQPIINGVRPPDRSPSTPMDTVEPNQTGHFTVVNLGWDDFAQITIEQDLPVSMFLLAIYGEMGTERL